METDEPKAPAPGWYWYRAENGDLEVIEVEGDGVNRVGSDVWERLPSQPDRGQFSVLGGTLVSRIEPPAASCDKARNAVLGALHLMASRIPGARTDTREFQSAVDRVMEAVDRLVTASRQ